MPQITPLHDYEQGKIYQYDGEKFVELEKSQEKKIPITDEAFDAVRKIRSEVKRPRPDLFVVASAMLLAAAEVPDVLLKVRAYGAKLYGNTAE